MRYNIDSVRSYNVFRKRNNIFEQRFIKFLSSKVSDKRILDIGSGTGKHLIFLSRFRPASLFGVDKSREMCRLFRKKAEAKILNIKLCNVSFEKKDFDEERFDLIFSVFTIHHISNLNLFFNKVNNILSKGGIFIASFNSFKGISPYFFKKEIPILLKNGRNKTVVFNLGRDDKEYRQAIRRSGLKIVKYVNWVNTAASIEMKFKKRYPNLKLKNIFLVVKKK